MATLQDLLQQRKELEAAIELAQRTEFAAAKAEILDQMRQYGLTVADLGKRKAYNPEKVRQKAAPKFKDPTSGGTWTGRGSKPRWLTAQLASGKRIEEFAIT